MNKDQPQAVVHIGGELRFCRQTVDAPVSKTRAVGGSGYQPKDFGKEEQRRLDAEWGVTFVGGRPIDGVRGAEL